MAQQSFSFTTFTLKATVYLFMLVVALQVANSARVLDEVDPQFSPTIGATNTVSGGQFSGVAPTTLVGDGNELPPIVDDGSDSDIPPIEDNEPDTVVPTIPDVLPSVSPVTTVDPSVPAPTVVAPTADVIPVVNPLNTVAPSDPAPTVIEPTADVPPVVSPVNTITPSDPAPTVIAPTADVPLVVSPVNTITPPSEPAPTFVSPTADVTPVTVTGPGPVSPVAPNVPATTASTVAIPEHAPLSFFMHDIMGGTSPSSRVVTGIIADSGVNGLPFSKPNSQVFPINGGVPLPNNINGILNNNHNIPFLTGLNTGSQSSTVLQNNGNNNVVSGNNLPFVTAGQLPSGSTLQELMFGTVTVIDDELTEGHELGSAVMGRAQGFYLTSSLDGTSHTMAITALFHSGEHHDGLEDTVSFFGVHRTASHESHIAVIGGTGKYESATGYATIGAIQMEDQHTTDGIDAILQINVYLTH